MSHVSYSTYLVQLNKVSNFMPLPYLLHLSREYQRHEHYRKVFYSYAGKHHDKQGDGLNVQKAENLGTIMSSLNRECITLTTKINFWKSFNILLSNFCHLYLFMKTIFLSFLMQTIVMQVYSH